MVSFKNYKKNTKLDIDLHLGSFNSISSPHSKGDERRSIVITGSPFKNLHPDINTKIHEYDGIFFSGKTDSDNFSEMKGYDLPQPAPSHYYCIDNNRSEVPIVIFVGTFNYWKGVDLAVKSFLSASSSDIKAKLILKCPISNSLENISVASNNIKHLELYFSCIKKYLEEAGVLDKTKLLDFSMSGFSLSIGNKLVIELDASRSSSAEMACLYRSADVFISLSRGETWCMPAAEALLAGCSVVIPEHFGIAQYIKNNPLVSILKSTPRSFDTYDFSDRSSGGGRAYIGHNIWYSETDYEQAAVMLRSALAERDLRFKKIKGSLQAQKVFNYASIGDKYISAIEDILD